MRERCVGRVPGAVGSANRQPPTANSLSGFTLLEVLLALSVLGIMGVMIFGTFRSLVDSTTRAENAMEDVHVVEALTNRIGDSLMAAAWYDSDPTLYAFRHEPATATSDADTISWVTTRPPFRKEGLEGLVRAELTVEEVDGEDALVLRSWSAYWEEDAEEIEEVEPVVITRSVKAFKVWCYDPQEKDWVEEWQRPRQLPPSVALVLTLIPEEPGDPVREVVKRVDLPMATVSRATKRGQRKKQDSSITPGKVELDTGGQR